MAWKPDYSAITPDFHYLSDTAVLVQAWKKAHAYARQHNWYADSLELDESTIELRRVVTEWANGLRRGTYRRFSPDLLRVVPAPKTKKWDVTNGWLPEGGDEAMRLRPLAHVSIRDQSISLAFLICLANIVETAQGNPELEINSGTRSSVVSYGHRLVASWDTGEARFRWGNAKLYRQYYSDYQMFVKRPELICDQLFPSSDGWAVVQADLSQFYDRVQRSELITKLKRLVTKAHPHKQLDKRFFASLERLFDWHWHPDDVSLATETCRSTNSDGLPQGLAASGFFANAYLLDFDQSLVDCFDKPLVPDLAWHLIDYSRYVDDMRFVVRLNGVAPETMVSELESHLRSLLTQHAPGLELNADKTKFKVGDGNASRSPVADAMHAVDAQVSKPMDVETAKHALEMLDGLLAVSGRRREQLKPIGTGQDQELLKLFSVEPDVRNETLERFVAHRWRATFRSLRIMADADGMTDSSMNMGRALLDQRAESFATELLRRWIEDPSNVRLLRVSLDVFPSRQHLQIVLKLLDSNLDDSTKGNSRLVCSYVASEILRAGSIETGFVHDGDELPADANVNEYRELLLEFAKEQLAATKVRPWYLKQQALLFSAVMQVPTQVAITSDLPLRRYVGVHHLISGEWPHDENDNAFSLTETVPLILIAHRISGDSDRFGSLLADAISELKPAESKQLLLLILSEDEDLLAAVWNQLDDSERRFWQSHFEAIGYLPGENALQWKPQDGDGQIHRLLTITCSPENPFRQETAVLRLMQQLLLLWGDPQKQREVGGGVLSPSRIEVRCKSWKRLADPTVIQGREDFEVSIRTQADEFDERYEVPAWCRKSERWRIEIGQIIRAAILGKTDYSKAYYVPSVVEGIRRYTGHRTSWFKRKHGLYNERRALGSRFLPISPWMSELIWRLLAWPGTESPDSIVEWPAEMTVAALSKVVDERLAELAGLFCSSLGIPSYVFPIKGNFGKFDKGRLRVAVVQSVLPHRSHFSSDGATLDGPVYRRKHRRHLSAMLRSVLKLLEIRAGYKDTQERVDLVVLPELAVHEDDLPLLLRFSDTAKCMVFAGLVFHRHPDHLDRLVNSGVWLLPVHRGEGRTIFTIEQGKYHLTPGEIALGITPYRPCQWIIEGQRGNESPWRLTAAICYDATDLRLASDMRDRSDGFIVSALNQDVATFDSMVAALHYHMYQHVILVNSGECGGTTVQAPFKAPHRKLVLHHHGNDAPLVSVFDLDLTHFRGPPDAGRREDAEPDDSRRKHPPAGFSR